MPASNIPFSGTAEEALDHIRNKLYASSRYDMQVYGFFVNALRTSDAITAQLERANAELAAAAEEDRETEFEPDVQDKYDHAADAAGSLLDRPDVGDLDDLPPDAA